jgi:hypothetical protein
MAEEHADERLFGVVAVIGLAIAGRLWTFLTHERKTLGGRNDKKERCKTVWSSFFSRNQEFLGIGMGRTGQRHDMTTARNGWDLVFLFAWLSSFLSLFFPPVLLRRRKDEAYFNVFLIFTLLYIVHTALTQGTRDSF